MAYTRTRVSPIHAPLKSCTQTNPSERPAWRALHPDIGQDGETTNEGQWTRGGNEVERTLSMNGLKSVTFS